MKFSIVIPVYNVEKYLVECIESVLQQTYTNYEVILIDDGSTDSSGAICEKYKEENENFHVYHQKNQGQSAARNKGVEKADGEYLLFLDSDDYYINAFCLERIAKSANGCDIVAYDYILYNKDAKDEWVPEQQTKNLEKQYESGIKYLQAALSRKPLYRWYPCIYAFRREFWKGNKFAFHEGILFEDLELVFRILLAAKIVQVIPEDIYVYRRNRSDSSTGVIKATSLINKLEVVQSNILYVQEYKTIPTDLKKKLCNNFAISYCSVLEYVFYVCGKEKKKVVHEIIKAKRVSKYLTQPKFKLLNMIRWLLGVRITSWILHLRHKLLSN